jgi:hypothetical protein
MTWPLVPLVLPGFGHVLFICIEIPILSHDHRSIHPSFLNPRWLSVELKKIWSWFWKCSNLQCLCHTCNCDHDTRGTLIYLRISFPLPWRLWYGFPAKMVIETQPSRLWHGIIFPTTMGLLCPQASLTMYAKLCSLHILYVWTLLYLWMPESAGCDGEFNFNLNSNFLCSVRGTPALAASDGFPSGHAPDALGTLDASDGFPSRLAPDTSDMCYWVVTN